MDKKHYNIKIYGKVQGVWYRASTEQKAKELGLLGFVQNEIDNSVYVEIEGPQADIDQFLTWCKEGPPLAKVSKIELKEAPLSNFTNFKIRR